MNADIFGTIRDKLCNVSDEDREKAAGSTVLAEARPNEQIVPPVDEFNKACLSDLDPDQLRILKEEMVWGTYGPTGEGPLRYGKVNEFTTDHIENILVNMPLRPVQRRVMLAILRDRYRKEAP